MSPGIARAVAGAPLADGSPEPARDGTPAAVTTDDVASELAQLPADARAESPLAEGFSTVCEASAAKNTQIVYERCWAQFVRWCRAHRLRAFPAHPEVVRVYLLALAADRRSLSTIEVTRAALMVAHRSARRDLPDSERLRQAVRTLRRALGAAPPREGIHLDGMRAISRACAGDPLAVRDRAMLLTTYWARLQRSQTAALDCPVGRDGSTLVIRVAEDDIRVLPMHPEEELCPVRAIDAWLRQRGTSARPALAPTYGPLFIGLHQAKARRGQPPHQLHAGERVGGCDVDRALKRRLWLARLPSSWSTRDLRAAQTSEEHPGLDADRAAPVPQILIPEVTAPSSRQRSA